MTEGTEGTGGTGGTPEAPHQRAAARAVVLEPEGRVLLIWHLTEDGFGWWATPGGGIDDGESPEVAARREAVEETGITEFELGPAIWRRVIEFPFRGAWYRQSEIFFLARVPRFVAVLSGDPSPSAGLLREHRWWSADEIAASADRFAPRRLAGLLELLLREGPPAEPLDVD